MLERIKDWRSYKVVTIPMAMVVMNLLYVPVFAKETADNTSEYSVWFWLGSVVGVLVVLLLVALLIAVIRKMGGKVEFGWKKNKKSFDERQMIARGIAYKWAFYTYAIYVVIVGLLDESGVTGIFMSFGGMWIGFLLAVCVFAVVCILKDAYMRLYENAKGVILLFSVISALNLLGGACQLGDSPLLENGAISASLLNFSAGVAFLVITLVFAARVAYSNKQMEEED